MLWQLPPSGTDKPCCQMEADPNEPPGVPKSMSAATQKLPQSQTLDTAQAKEAKEPWGTAGGAREGKECVLLRPE